MKKLILFLTLFLFCISSFSYAQISIQEARNLPAGTVVTVKGIATNGSEMGIIRYFQDGTAGIAAYGPLTNPVNRGDSITVTGTLKVYNQLLEIDPVSSLIVNSTGNPLPQPVVVTPNQIGEAYEAKLIQVNNVVFNDAGQLYTGNKKYTFTANGQTGYMYIKNGQDFVGTIIPSGELTLIALCSQFDYSNPNDGYQLLPRDLNDILQPSSIYFTETLSNPTFTKTMLEFTWKTNIAGTTELFYGSTEQAFASNHTMVSGSNTDHLIDLEGLSAGDISWVQAFSVSGSDTAFSAITPFATISNSTGKMIAYFNHPVDTSYSNGIDAIYLHKSIDDTVINYINRAKFSIDFTMYNFNNSGLSNISQALIAAANRGVRVRVIGCGTTANIGMDQLGGTAVHLLIGPTETQRTGIMHNKFIIFDAYSPDPNDPILWTGSTNFTDGQINLDANNVIIVQDQSLAKAYQIEFEEMWGSTDDAPNAVNAKFGFNKRNNTPHEFVIDGKRVECYFSPSDGVNAKIVDVINTSDSDLSIATMLITRNEMAYAIVDRFTDGVAVNVITNAEGNNGSTVNEVMESALTFHYTFDNVSNGIMHHKFMVVDQFAPLSDPMLFTGSHNWSASADNDNDENTLIVHDQTMANIYYQSFVKRFVDNQGVLGDLNQPPVAVNDNGTTMINQLITIAVLENDEIEAPVTLSIEQAAANGNSFIPFANPNVINYMPATDFYGNDSIVYKIIYQANPSLNATAKIYLTVVNNSGVAEVRYSALKVNPNPARDIVHLSLNNSLSSDATLSFFDMMGKLKYSINLAGTEKSVSLNLKSIGIREGVYLLVLDEQNKKSVSKLVVQ